MSSADEVFKMTQEQFTQLVNDCGMSSLVTTDKIPELFEECNKQINRPRGKGTVQYRPDGGLLPSRM